MTGTERNAARLPSPIAEGPSEATIATPELSRLAGEETMLRGGQQILGGSDSVWDATNRNESSLDGWAFVLTPEEESTFSGNDIEHVTTMTKDRKVMLSDEEAASFIPSPEVAFDSAPDASATGTGAPATGGQIAVNAKSANHETERNGWETPADGVHPSCREAALLARDLALGYDGPYRELIRLQAHCLANEVEQACYGTLSYLQPEDSHQAAVKSCPSGRWEEYPDPAIILESTEEAPSQFSGHGATIAAWETSLSGQHSTRQVQQRKTTNSSQQYRKKLIKFRSETLSNQRVSQILKNWLFDHFLNPYPRDEEKHQLMRETGLTFNQLNNWFINARVRLWKPLVNALAMKRRGTEFAAQPN